MERITSVTNPLTLAAATYTYQAGIVRRFGLFALRCLKTCSRANVDSARYNPYWIGFVPAPRLTPRSYR